MKEKNSGKEFIGFFKEVSRDDTARAGGKGAQLGEMFNAGFPVPDGFVVLTAAFDEATYDNHINERIYHLIEKVDADNTESLNAAAKSIQGMILKAGVPAGVGKAIKQAFKRLDAGFVAVRSSATAEDASQASWAGELDTYTNIQEKNLMLAIKRCWASLFSPRAIIYRIEKKFRHEEISVAVVVQRMVNSEVSGVVFTKHPVTNDNKKILIEAGYGLGESVVSGKITPDSYVFDKETGLIEEIKIGRQNTVILKSKGKTIEKKLGKKLQEKQKLSGKQIIELSEICKKIETHYQCPQDIEWGFEKGRFYILQTRPITT